MAPRPQRSVPRGPAPSPAGCACSAQVRRGAKWCSLPRPSPPRRAKDVVLRFEGRLTRTRGYQAAGAEVRAHAGAAPRPGSRGLTPVTAAATSGVPIRPAPPRPRVPKRASVPGTVPYHPGTRGEPDCSEVDVPEGTVQRLSWLSPVRADWTHGVSHREKVTGAFPPRLTQRRGVFPASPFSCSQLNVSMC